MRGRESRLKSNSFSTPRSSRAWGFAGMRERIKQLGGDLEIQSSEQGTIVRATMPVGKLPGANANGVGLKGSGFSKEVA